MTLILRTAETNKINERPVNQFHSLYIFPWEFHVMQIGNTTWNLIVFNETLCLNRVTTELMRAKSFWPSKKKHTKIKVRQRRSFQSNTLETKKQTFHFEMAENSILMKECLNTWNYLRFSFVKFMSLVHLLENTVKWSKPLVLMHRKRIVSVAVDRIEQLTWTIIALNIDGELMKGNRY